MLLLLLDYELPQHRGKQKAIQNIEEQLFILLNFLHLGSTSMTELLTYPFYKSHSSVTQLLHSIVGNIKDTPVNLLLIFRKDRIKELQEVGLIMGCTIVPIIRPSGKLTDGMKFISGKHHSYCVKVEIGVNPKNGLASTISDFFPGSVHDYEIFKNHYPTFSQHLKGSKIMADSAYMGAKAELVAIITKPHGTQYLSKHRVIAERFFGR
ncbi:putative DDE superfamily endonuclease [Monocercomonoides exilis]|uniref:putative DDE superfamily endonuclease n=1 Tax=Monocercomonoides exilis TaxID=2049356 RepID=UPI003559B8E4|nr:putative DDE superfamily endonuclease [Monocercomonoides exilis]|eukprot:MONOS_10634.1-p1 / transcript=MONOS_10634.1 / gene=MONOS_10634 / organism=Monocercomonoides_exilis_PA203 / gene_product=unspecified product / transcript_product=unspecified product / location=Mono_scaffold00491:24973-25599(+) / protein_length=208 / sequence_SO=supercontig / SO=protein_coding / is_pseudo=false